MTNDTAVKALPARSAIKMEDTWRLEDIFTDDAAWETEFKSVKDMLPGIKEFEGKLEDAQTLFEALQYQDKLMERLGKLYTYAHMRYDQDTTNSFYQGLDGRMKSLYSQTGSQLAFIVPEILSIDEAKLSSFLEEKQELKLYEHALQEINLQRPHVLSSSEEALLAEASEVMGASSNTFGMLNNADLEFPSIKDENGEEVEVTHGR
ncbi:MAG: oligoendopeptidase F, partial [Bacillota bacterium]|nr:oligoendopeptidase F [Bacillota bacterium]